MCGIAGAFRFSERGDPVELGRIARLNDLQHRRGPDGVGLWTSDDRTVALGHRRLAIIDTSPAGAQPMSDATGRWTITFNGEIYNYRALRSELEQLGYAFRTNSDTEVLINAVNEWGEAALKRLRGMFAFALWDSAGKELWLVRDSYGIKPLYVAESGGTVWFASQARALAGCAPVNIERDPAALTGLYLWGFVPEPFSWWSGIKMLPAGHLQRIRYGAPPPPPKPFDLIQQAFVAVPSEPLAAGELRHLMVDSIRHHLVADVPVGVFLSAGIDSNVIAALAAEQGSRIQTVTLAFAEYAGTPNDEAPLAEAAAKALHSDHVTVRIDREEFEGLLDDFIASMDQPTIDGLNTYLVSRAAASQGLKVVLSGLGGDELFGGYPSFRQIPMLLGMGARVKALTGFGRALGGMLRAIAPNWVHPKLAGVFTHCQDMAHAYILRRALHLEGELDALIDESWRSDGLDRLATAQSLQYVVSDLARARVPHHAQIALLESFWYMRNQLLRDTDWSSMAHGLEVRVPYVDVTLLERVGPAVASRAPPTKRDLAACAQHLIPEILARPKTGFTTPVRNWAAGSDASSPRGLRGWAENIHRRFRTVPAANAAPAAWVAAA